MRRRLALLGALLGGCTSVHVAMRSDCWVRTVDRWPGQVTEEVGPCARPPPAWTNDRLTRLVQECVAQRDYRWENRAIARWQRGEPLPARDQKATLDACLSEATRTAVGENELLQAQVKDLTAERDRLRSHDDAITTALGEAAKKPAGSAVATASAEGKGDGASHQDSKSEESRSSRQASESAPPMIVQPPAAQPVILQSAPAAAPQPIVVQAQAPQPYPMPQVQPIVVQAQAPQPYPVPQMQPIVVNPPQPQTIIRYVRVPAKRPVKKPLCPPAKDETANASMSSQASSDCVKQEK